MSVDQKVKVSDNDENIHNQAKHSCLDDSSADKGDLNGLLSPNLRWEPSEELDALLNVIMKPLQRFERRSILKEFPRPAFNAAFTPTLDNYLSSMISGIKISDNSLRDIQDKLLDVLKPLCILYENCSMKYESMDATTHDKATVVGMFNCLKKSVTLVGDTSAQLSPNYREQVLTKLNQVLSSLGKEEFPDAGKQLFGNGFESRLCGSAPRRFQGQFRGGRGQYQGFQGFHGPAQGFQSSTPSFQGRGRTHNYTP